MLFWGLSSERVVVADWPGWWLPVGALEGCVQYLAGLTNFIWVMSAYSFKEYPKEVAKYK